MSAPRRRQGGGALLAISSLGVVVLAILIFTQGYLGASLNQTDAVLSGRRAEYLSDAALAEALWILQTERNSTYKTLFEGGGTTIEPTRAQALAPAGTTVGTVVAEVTSLDDFHGDGRGFYGRVQLESQVGVPRRVSRTLGISAWRTVQLGFEFKSVDMTPPAAFADKLLYAHELKDLPQVELWYVEDIQNRWDQVRLSTISEIKADADLVVSIFADFISFMQTASDLWNRTDDWPNQVSSFGSGSYGLSPEVSVEGAPFGASAKATGVTLKLDANGDVKGYGKFLGIKKSWHESNRPEIPKLRPIIRDVVDKALNALGAAIFGEGKDTVRSALQEAAGVSASSFHSAAGTPPPLVTAAWPPFRADGADLSAPAYVAASRISVNQDELLIHPPTPPSPVQA